MKTNPGKFQFIVLGVKNVTPFRLNVNGKIIACSNAVKLLGKTIDNELKFTEAATRGVLWKKVFLEISQNSQENTCARASGTGVFLWILRNF